MLNETPETILHSSSSKINTGRLYVIGGAVDPFFRLPLWPVTSLDSEILWAYNVEHLQFLAAHIQSKLRERNLDNMSNRSLGSRLPKWMTSKKNREMVLKKIGELQNK